MSTTKTAGGENFSISACSSSYALRTFLKFIEKDLVNEKMVELQQTFC